MMYTIKSQLVNHYTNGTRNAMAFARFTLLAWPEPYGARIREIGDDRIDTTYMTFQFRNGENGYAQGKQKTAFG